MRGFTSIVDDWCDGNKSIMVSMQGIFHDDCRKTLNGLHEDLRLAVT